MVNEEQIQAIFTRYLGFISKHQKTPSLMLPDLKRYYDKAFRQAISYLEAQYSDDSLNLATVGSSNKVTVEENRDNIQRVNQFLDAVIKIKDDGPYFDLTSAQDLQKQYLDRFYTLKSKSKPSTSQSHYFQIQNLDILPRYRRHLPIEDSYWASDADLRHMITKFNLMSKIEVSTMDPNALGSSLALIKRDHQNDQQAYHFSYILNNTFSLSEGGNHWVAIKFSVDPVARKVRYDFQDSMAVSDEQKVMYKAAIEAAITFREEGYEAYSSSQGWTLDEHSTLVGQGLQHDWYSCGYRALHNVLQYPEIRGDNIWANRYAAIDISPSGGAYPSRRLHNTFVGILTEGVERLAQPEVQSFLPQRTSTKVSSSEKIQPLVGEFLRTYSPSVSMMSFPGNFYLKDKHPLSQNDYTSLFSQMASFDAILTKPLSELCLSHVNLTAIKGLNAFFKSPQFCGFKSIKLRLDLDDKETVLQFLKEFKDTLILLSESDIDRIIIEDTKGILTEVQINELQLFVAKNKSITAKLDLPSAFETSKFQRQIDQKTDEHQRLKQGHKLLDTQEKTKDKASTSKAKMPIRQRPKLDMSHTQKTIEVELQEGVEADVIVEKRTRKTKATLGFSFEIIKQQDLLAAAESNDFHIFAPLANGLTREKFVSLATQWFKDLKPHSQETRGMTKQALAQLTAFPQYFTEGINLDYLPQGFALLSDPQNPRQHILHYDPAILTKNPLLLHFETKAALAPLGHEFMSQILGASSPLLPIWQALQAAPHYSRQDNEIFRRAVPLLLNLNEASLTQLIALCQESGVFSFNKLNFIIENIEKAKASYLEPYDETKLVDVAWMSQVFKTLEERQAFISIAHALEPKIPDTHALLNLLEDKKPQDTLLAYHLTDQELNALLLIYSQYGPAGINKILNVWQQAHDLVGYMPETLLKDTARYEALIISNDVLESARTLRGFSPVTRQWWDKLYQNHTPKNVSLVELVKSFTAFLQTLELKGLNLYPLSRDEIKMPFIGAQNMPMALGRILSILDHVSSFDRDAQWKFISSIDLSHEKTIALINGQNNKSPVAFIIPVLQDASALSPDDVYAQRRNIVLKKLAVQKHRLPLSFYLQALQDLDDLVTSNALPKEAAMDLMNILYTATTGHNYRHFVKDSEAMTQWQHIINNIKTIQLPSPLGQMTPQAKIELTTSLASLVSLPALPILDKLVQVMVAPLQHASIFNLGRLRTHNERMMRSREILEHFVTMFGMKIYMGMKFYSPEDMVLVYPEDRDLFEEHLVIARALEERDIADLYLPLISTFKLKNQPEILDGLLASLSEITGAEGEPQYPFKRALIEKLLSRLIDIEDARELTPEKLMTLMQQFKPLIDSEYVRFEAEYALAQNVLIQMQEGVAVSQEAMQNFVNKQQIKAGEKESILSFSEDNINQMLELLLKKIFPAQYFESLKANPQGPDLEVRVSEIFKDTQLKTLFEKIRLSYLGASEEDLQKLLDALDDIFDNVSAHYEKVQLLTLLSDERLTLSSMPDYLKLLEVIASEGHSSFVYFMQSSSLVEHSESTSLASQAAYFISKGLPLIRQALKLSELEVLDMLASLILKTQPLEFDALIKTNAEQQANFEALKALLAHPPVSIDVLKQQLARMPTYIKNNEATKTLKAHLDSLEKRPLLETIKVKKTREVIVEEQRKTSGIVSTARGFLSTISLGYIAKPPEFETIRVKKTIDYEVEEERAVSREIDIDVLHQTLATYNKLQLGGYEDLLLQILGYIDELVLNYPVGEDLLLSLVKPLMHLNSQDLEDEAPQILVTFQNVEIIYREFMALKDQDLVISLCEHFNHESGSFNVETLLGFFKGEPPFEHYPNLNEETKKQILHVISALLNNDKPCSEVNMINFVNLCHENQQNPILLNQLKALYKNAPYPTLDLVESWFNETKDEADPQEAALLRYKAWNKQPVAREDFNLQGDRVNGFDIEYAKKQAQVLVGVTYTDEDLVHLQNEIVRSKTLDTDELLAEIQGLKTLETNETETLVALVAELLYRTKGLPQVGVAGDRVWGRSFEINTTQYLAIHSMLKTGGHATSQIGTGEGKSRIMMILVACQYAMGRTVDFVTADMSLATRDYLEYEAFFKVLGAQTNLIQATTPAEEYKKTGINFSDASNLSLFRNKARSEGKAKLVIADDALQCALMLDEADKTYFDASDTRFNYSVQADVSIKNMPWIYELMVEFFSEAKNQDLYHGPTSDAEACNQAFKDFARGKLNDAEMKRLLSLSIKQLETWQNAAITALSLKYPEDFTIYPEVTIITAKGPTKVSQAKLVSGGRVSENAKYSFGVQQCLHARLNLLSHNRGHEAPRDALEQVLKSRPGQHPFSIDPENQIVYSSTSKSLLDDYAQGDLLAVTGTAGSIAEREEAKSVYGSQSKNSQMTFIEVPRHRGQNRKDFPVAMTKNEKAHHERILFYVRESLRKNQPILLVCENDKESQVIYKFLDMHLHADEKRHLSRISADTSIAEEAAYVKERAGQPQAITVSTTKLGRGTDIKLHGAANEHGLAVMATYLPRERDYYQIIGRSGRFGAQGQSRLILDKERVKAQLGVNVLPTEFYTATECFLRRQQAWMDKFAQKERLIKDAVGDFRLSYTQFFFEHIFKTSHQEELLAAWSRFFDSTDKAWQSIWPELSTELGKTPIAARKIQEMLLSYGVGLKQEWRKLQQELKPILPEDAHVVAMHKHEAFVDIDRKIAALLNGYGSAIHYKTVIAEQFDEAYIGRAVIYRHFIDSFKAFFYNIAAAWRGDGIWFPNLQATFRGHMSWSQFFFGTWGTPPFQGNGAVTLIESTSYERMSSQLPASSKPHSETAQKVVQNEDQVKVLPPTKEPEDAATPPSSSSSPPPPP